MNYYFSSFRYSYFQIFNFSIFRFSIFKLPIFRFSIFRFSDKIMIVEKNSFWRFSLQLRKYRKLFLASIRRIMRSFEWVISQPLTPYGCREIGYLIFLRQKFDFARARATSGKNQKSKENHPRGIERAFEWAVARLLISSDCGENREPFSGRKKNHSPFILIDTWKKGVCVCVCVCLYVYVFFCTFTIFSATIPAQKMSDSSFEPSLRALEGFFFDFWFSRSFALKIGKPCFSRQFPL